MLSIKKLRKEYSKQINKLLKGDKYKLTRENVQEHLNPEDKGLFVLFHNKKAIYVGQAGANINKNHEGQGLKEKLLQYTGQRETGIKSVRTYLNENELSADDLKFTFLTLKDSRLIKVIEVVAIAEISREYNLLNK